MDIQTLDLSFLQITGLAASFALACYSSYQLGALRERRNTQIAEHNIGTLGAILDFIIQRFKYRCDLTDAQMDAVLSDTAQRFEQFRFEKIDTRH